MLANRMARRKIFEVRINLPITADLLDRVDAALENDEYRVDFIRNAIKAELERRADQAEHKQGARSPARRSRHPSDRS